MRDEDGAACRAVFLAFLVCLEPFDKKISVLINLKSQQVAGTIPLRPEFLHSEGPKMPGRKQP